jgi:hypothetical protein
VSGLILTIEGILLGISPLYFDKLGKAKLGASTISVTAIALFLSLITILFADTTANPNILAWVYFGDIAGLLILTVFFAGSSWYVALRSKDGAQKDKATESERGESLRDKQMHEKETSEPTPAVNETPKSEEPNKDIEREKLRYYWDYERSNFTQMLVILFSALIGVATILNAQVASPIIHLNVFYEDAALLVVFAYLGYRLMRIIYRFHEAVVRTNDYLIELDSGKANIPSLRELCGITTDPSADWKEVSSWWKSRGIILIAIAVAIFVILANYSQIVALLGF